MKIDFSKLLLDESPDTIIALTPSGEVLCWTTGAEVIFGYTSTEAIGRRVYGLIVPLGRIEEERRILSDAQLSSIPFVFITSTLTDHAARAAGLALGARAFLFRPIDPQVLLNEIEACLKNNQED